MSAADVINWNIRKSGICLGFLKATQPDCSHHILSKELQNSFLSFIILEYIILQLKLLSISTWSTDNISSCPDIFISK